MSQGPFVSTTPNIQDVILTSGSPYRYWSVVSVDVPTDLKPTDIVCLKARAELTHVFPWPVMIASLFQIGASDGGSEPAVVGSPPMGEDLAWATGESGQIHKEIFLAADVKGFTGPQQFSLTIYAASGDMTAEQNYLVLGSPETGPTGYVWIEATVN